MEEWVLERIRGVIACADAGGRADECLRKELAAPPRLPPEEKREVARTVLNYFRWQGWLDQTAPLQEKLRQAEELAERFRNSPQSFSQAELRAKAVPEWVHAHALLSPQTLRAFQAEPKLWLRARRGTGAEVAAALGDCLIHAGIPDALEYTGTKDLFTTPEFHAGKFEIQDIGSQAVALVCNPQAGQSWMDACAGEGGKTLLLAQLMEGKGLVWATDRAEWRLKVLKRRASRAGVFNYRAKPWLNAASVPVKGPFDGVLVDAPCSGVGTWQRNPHARWTTTIKDVVELAELQGGLLDKVASTVKPGGRLVYSVCSLTREETTEVAARFSANHGEFQRISLKNPFTGVEEEDCWLLPEITGGIGMFVAAWKLAKHCSH